jgi:hypothetical protein
MYQYIHIDDRNSLNICGDGSMDDHFEYEYMAIKLPVK